jgi:hypothetical protein
MRVFVFCLAATLALPGCALSVSSSTGSAGSVAGSQVSVSSGSPLGNAIIVGVMVADGVQYYRLGPDGKTQVRSPEMDPARKISVQDCTRPIDRSAGNLMCR